MLWALIQTFRIEEVHKVGKLRSEFHIEGIGASVGYDDMPVPDMSGICRCSTSQTNIIGGFHIEHCSGCSVVVDCSCSICCWDKVMTTIGLTHTWELVDHDECCAVCFRDNAKPDGIVTILIHCCYLNWAGCNLEAVVEGHHLIETSCTQTSKCKLGVIDGIASHNPIIESSCCSVMMSPCILTGSSECLGDNSRTTIHSEAFRMNLPFVLSPTSVRIDGLRTNIDSTTSEISGATGVKCLNSLPSDTYGEHDVMCVWGEEYIPFRGYIASIYTHTHLFFDYGILFLDLILRFNKSDLNLDRGVLWHGTRRSLKGNT